MNTHSIPFRYLTVGELTAEVNHSDGHLTLNNVAGFFLCQSGDADILLDGKAHHLAASQLCFYLPATTLTVVRRSTDMEGFAVACEREFVVPMVERLLTAQAVMTLYTHPCLSLTEEQREDVDMLVSLMTKQRQCLRSLPPTSAEHAAVEQLVLSLGASLFNLLMCVLSSDQSLPQGEIDAKERIVGRFVVSLLHSYKEERTVLHYAREQGISPRYFSAIVKERSGHTAQEWIQHIVVGALRHKLKYTDLSCKEIAMEFHFSTQSFFGKFFKQNTGLTPLEYRRQARPAHSQQTYTEES